MSKVQDDPELDGPHTPPTDKQNFLPTPLPSGQPFEVEREREQLPEEDTDDTQKDTQKEIHTPLLRAQTPGEDSHKEALIRNWKPLSEEEIAIGGESVSQSLRTANETIEALTELLVKTKIQKSHFQLQNKLLTIESHEAAQRFEVENNITKREVDRLRLIEQEGESPRQLLGEYNKSSTKVLESYKRKLRRAKLRLEDAVFDIEWRDREIQRLRARLEPVTPKVEPPGHHAPPQYQPQYHGPPQSQPQPQPPYQLPPPPQPTSLQSSPVSYYPHPMSPVGVVQKNAGHRRTQSAYENRQLDSRPPPLNIPPRQHIQLPQMDALGLLASQALHEHNRTELMSPVAFRGPRQLQPPPQHIMPSSPLKDRPHTDLCPSSPEKRRRGSSASTISVPSDDEHLDLSTTPGTPSPVKSRISPQKKLARERELAVGGVNRVLDFSPVKDTPRD